MITSLVGPNFTPASTNGTTPVAMFKIPDDVDRSIVVVNEGVTPVIACLDRSFPDNKVFRVPQNSYVHLEEAVGGVTLYIRRDPNVGGVDGTGIWAYGTEL